MNIFLLTVKCFTIDKINKINVTGDKKKMVLVITRTIL